MQNYSCVHNLFEKRVSIQPDEIALIDQDKTMTYKQLNDGANQMAHYLKRRGMKTKSKVAVVMNRGFDLIQSVLGILKAGGVYVPIDPSNSTKSRIDFIVKECDISFILSQANCKGSLPTNKDTIFIDKEREQINKERIINLKHSTSINDLAYISYTSGSSGKPKGIAVPHRSILGFTFDQRMVHLQNKPISLHYSSISWDVFVLETWPALVNGGRCVLYNKKIPTSNDLKSLIKKYQINTLWLTKSLFDLVIDDDRGALTGIETVMTGGEALSPSHIIKAQQQYPHLKIINGYGPSECVVFSTCYVVPPNFSKHEKSVPIGTAIGDRQIYVLNEKLEPVKKGEIGELYVGGPGVGCGYINNVEKTSEVFIKNPFVPKDEYMYKSGDYVRENDDGHLEFISRKDQQVKIRGLRIELGEIEVAMGKHPNILQAAVVVKEINGDKQMVAYIVPKRNDAHIFEKVQKHLEDSLPKFMHPSFIEILSELPLTDNGKVNKQNLISRDVFPVNKEKFIPHSETEKILLEVWESEIRGQIGKEDNFFSLGGHSLLAAKIINRLSKYNIEVTIEDIFKCPSIKELAACIEEKEFSNEKPNKLSIPKTDKENNIPLSYAQKRLWFLHQLEPNLPVYNEAFIYTLEGSLNPTILEESLKEVIHRHECLRTNFVMNEEEVTQKISNISNFRLEVFTFQGESNTEIEQKAWNYVRKDAKHIFNLETDSLIYSKLIKFSDEKYWLFVNIHHIVFDGWSLSVFMRDLAEIYEAKEKGENINLKPLPIQYKDYTMWQTSLENSLNIKKQMDYWVNWLKDSNTELNLPTDYPRPNKPSHNGRIKSFKINKALLHKLKEISQKEEASLFMTLTAGLNVLFYRYCGQDDINIGTPVANRRGQEAENLIGFFANSLVIRSKLKGEETFNEFLRKVRDTTLEAFSNQDAPLEQVIHELKIKRNATHSPLFKVIIALHNELIEDIAFSGINMKPIEVHTDTSKVDLILSLTEKQDYLEGYFEYSTDIYKEESIEWMIEQYLNLLNRVVEEPTTKIDEIDFVMKEDTPVESNNQLAEGISFIKQFEENVKLYPEVIAIQEGEEKYTYQELNIKSNQVAHYLRNLGMTSQSIVALYLENSAKTLICLLGIVKAGISYLPINLGTTEEDYISILETMKPSYLLTEEDFYDELPETDVEAIFIEDEWEQIVEAPFENPNTPSGNEEVTFFTYNDSSKNQLKVEKLSQRDIMSLLINSCEQVDRKDCWIVSNSIHSLPFVLEFWGGITSGIQLHLVPQWILNSANQYLKYIKDNEITQLFVDKNSFVNLHNNLFQNLPIKSICMFGHVDKDYLIPWFEHCMYNDFKITQFFGQEEIGKVFAYQTITNKNVKAVPNNEFLSKKLNSTHEFRILDKNHTDVPLGALGDLYVHVISSYKDDIILDHEPWLNTGLKVRKLPLGQFTIKEEVNLEQKTDEHGWTEEEFVDDHIMEKVSKMIRGILSLKDHIHPEYSSNFFELGGNSLLATKLISAINDEYKLHLPLSTIFEMITIGELVNVINEKIGHMKDDSTESIVKIPRENEIPLSLNQIRLWTSEQLTPGTPLYNVPIALDITGELEVKYLNRSLNLIIEEHEILRTTFSINKQGKPIQVIHKKSEVNLEVIPAKGLTEDQLKKEIERQAKSVFHLEDGPLYNFTLWEINDKRNILLMNFHHLIIDGSSINMLIDKMLTYYTNIIEKKPIEVERNELQYADYSVWQQNKLNSEKFHEQLSYWKKKLSNLPKLNLPKEKQSSAVSNNLEGEEYVYRIPREVTNDIFEYCKLQGRTLYNFSLSAFNVVMHYLSKQDEIVLGTVQDGRNQQNLEGILGFIVNTLVLRTDLNNNPTLDEVQRHVQKIYIEALDHQDIPFDKIIEELRPDRLDSTPFFQVVFAVNDLSTFHNQTDYLTTDLYPIKHDLPKFNIHFNIEHTKEDFYVIVMYKSNLFSKSTIEKMVYLYQKVLAMVIETPYLTLKEVSEQLNNEEKEYLKEKQQEFLRKKKKSLIF